MGDSSSQQPSLTVLGGPMAGQRLVLDEAVANLLIGSDPSCDFYLPHESVSPIHARLWVDLEGAVLHDTSSPHGVYVNDERVVGKHPLRNGDIVWLGPPGGADAVMIQCVLAEGAAEETSTAAAAEPVADTSEREALEALAPTLAAGASFADRDERPAAEEPPAWDPEPPPIPASPAAPDLEESARTQAFRLPADLAAAPRAAAPAPPQASAPPPSDDLDQLFSEHVSEPPPVPAAAGAVPNEEPEAYVAEPEPTLVEAEPTVVEPEPTLMDTSPAFVEPEPVLADEAYATEAPAYVAEPEPEIVEAVLPAPEPTLIDSGAAPPVASGVPAAGLASDFDDMMFSVPDDAPPAPAAAPPPVAVPPAQEETVLLPAPPRVQGAPPASPPPALPVSTKPPAAAAAPVAPAPARPPAAPPRAPAARATAPGSGTVPPRAAPPRQARPAAEAPPRPPSKAVPIAALAGGGVLLAAAVAGAYWFLARSDTPRTATAAPPPAPSTLATAPVTTLTARPAPEVVEPVPEPTPEIAPTVAPAEDVVTIVRTATPPPRPSAAPTAAATPRPAETRRPDPVDPAAATRARIAAQVTGLLGQAQSALAARNYEAALAHYDAVLKLDPQNGAAQAGKTSTTAARAHGRKAFVAGRTVVRTEKSGGGLAGFESAGVSVQKAPDFLGRVEYAMSPASVQPGDPWDLKIYVVNEGKKAIKISGLSVATVVNGAPAGSGGPPKAREVAPQQRVMVDELSGTWPPNVTSWRTDVKITAGKNETLQSQLTWR